MWVSVFLESIELVNITTKVTNRILWSWTSAEKWSETGVEEATVFALYKGHTLLQSWCVLETHNSNTSTSFCSCLCFLESYLFSRVSAAKIWPLWEVMVHWWDSCTDFLALRCQFKNPVCVEQISQSSPCPHKWQFYRRCGQTPALCALDLHPTFQGKWTWISGKKTVGVPCHWHVAHHTHTCVTLVHYSYLLICVYYSGQVCCDWTLIAWNASTSCLNSKHFELNCRSTCLQMPYVLNPTPAVIVDLDEV